MPRAPRRARRDLGAFAKTPSFMTARIRFESRRIDRFASGSPSTSSRSAS
jgi:hypothetical protein